MSDIEEMINAIGTDGIIKKMYESLLADGMDREAAIAIMKNSVMELERD